MDNARAAKEKASQSHYGAAIPKDLAARRPYLYLSVLWSPLQPPSWLSGGKAPSGFVSAGGSRIKKVFVIKTKQLQTNFILEDFSGGGVGGI